jgi:hypothetical protein
MYLVVNNKLTRNGVTSPKYKAKSRDIEGIMQRALTSAMVLFLMRSITIA